MNVLRMPPADDARRRDGDAASSPPELTTRFIAYTYPGWHSASWRAGLEEWELMDTFVPYFPGHEPLPRPLDGPYDDSDPETARKQIRLARDAGIDGFTYFLFFDQSDFVLSRPLTAALDVVEADDETFSIGTTWCLRLPHHELPLGPETDGRGVAPPTPRSSKPAPAATTPAELAGTRGTSSLDELDVGAGLRLIGVEGTGVDDAGLGAVGE
ncbi:MAG TPA: glycoside hydrolase family 99-like domain-containing protein [Gaiellaceae bacterium]|jgi:hypothetical protein|nr:glycoside hydrolase family 99-like domain-containing protein [Gaiellaceae bacterium]